MVHITFIGIMVARVYDPNFRVHVVPNLLCALPGSHPEDGQGFASPGDVAQGLGFRRLFCSRIAGRTAGRVGFRV